MDLTINTPQIKKARKSVPLTERQMLMLKRFVARFEKQTQAAVSLGVDRNVLNRLLVYGTAHESTVNTILKNLPHGL